MSQVHGVQCNALCGASILWATERGDRAPTKAEMEKEARRRGWNAPDKLGRHWCWNCRSEAGRDQWRRKENLRVGLDPNYGRGQCTCKPGDPPEMRQVCALAGHPGVVPLHPGQKRASDA